LVSSILPADQLNLYSLETSHSNYFINWYQSNLIILFYSIISPEFDIVQLLSPLYCFPHLICSLIIILYKILAWILFKRWIDCSMWIDSINYNPYWNLFLQSLNHWCLYCYILIEVICYFHTSIDVILHFFVVHWNCYYSCF